MTSLSLGRARLADRASTADELRTAGVLAFLAGATFLIGTMLAASIAPGYDSHDAAISDLGVIAETAALFNAVLIVVGLSDLVVGVLLYRAWRRPSVLAAFVAGGLGAVGAGAFALDHGGIHSLFALGAFLGFNIEALACARCLSGPMRWISLLAGIVGLGYVVLMVVGDAGNAWVFGAIGHGGSERMIAYPAMLWLLAFSGYLLAARRSDASPHS